MGFFLTYTVVDQVGGVSTGQGLQQQYTQSLPDGNRYELSCIAPGCLEQLDPHIQA